MTILQRGNKTMVRAVGIMEDSAVMIFFVILNFEHYRPQFLYDVVSSLGNSKNVPNVIDTQDLAPIQIVRSDTEPEERDARRIELWVVIRDTKHEPQLLLCTVSQGERLKSNRTARF
ncbi:hypothetical protein PM082_012140 [Marasmius tenuissimus]|nr:hypothetical protein PM082_012140 [Marasmius tenuissimus]